MKRFVIGVVLIVLALFLGTGIWGSDQLPQHPANCFWGFVYHIERHAGNPPWEEQVPSDSAKVELWFNGELEATEYTDHVGEYCIYRDYWEPGYYVIKVACLEKQVHRVGNENIHVEDFVFRSPCRIILPTNPPQLDSENTGLPQP